jgi:ATP-binding cassette subfamily B protein
MVTASLLGLVPPLTVARIIDSTLPNRDAAELVELVVVMIVASLVGGLVNVWQNYLVTVMSQNVILEIRAEMYATLLGQSLRFFTQTKTGEMISRLQNDVAGVQGILSSTVVSIFTNAFTLLSTIVVLVQVDGRLSIAALAILPLFVVPTRQVGRVRKSLAKQTQEQLAALMSHTQETLSIGGFLLVRLFGAWGYETERFRARSEQMRDLQLRQSLVGRWFFMAMSMFSSIGPALIYLVGGMLVIGGTVTAGAVVAFVMYLGRLYGPVTALANAHVEIVAATSVARRIFEFLDLRPDVPEPEAPSEIAPTKGHLRFEFVSMAYTPGVWALRDVQFDARPGEMVAIVGPSGAGKTTLAYLANRLYDPTVGRIVLDDVDLRSFSAEARSVYIGSVTQDAAVAHASVKENLRYGRSSATSSELRRACRLAQIDDVIERLPSGYDTILGSRGYRLSGGERQRLALARVFLRDPRLLILDEATSSLDSQSEELIQDALERLLVGRTSLVIAHRLSTVLRADQILVLDRGKIVERGRHEELVGAGGLYSSLYKKQLSGLTKGSKQATQIVAGYRSN